MNKTISLFSAEDATCAETEGLSEPEKHCEPCSQKGWPPAGVNWDFVSPTVVLKCADCLEVLPKLTGVDAIVTDPPYDIVSTGGGIGAKRQYLKDITGRLDGGFDHSILSRFASWMVFCSKSSIIPLIQRAERSGLRWQLLTWNKINPTPLSNGNYLPDTEYIIHAFSKLPECDFKDKSRWVAGSVEHTDIPHPTVKPLYVMQKLLKTSCPVGSTVLDPFMGSGTTGIACIRTRRRFIGVEICKKYFDIAVERIRHELAQLTLPLKINENTSCTQPDLVTS